MTMPIIIHLLSPSVSDSVNADALSLQNRNNKTLHSFSRIHIKRIQSSWKIRRRPSKILCPGRIPISPLHLGIRVEFHLNSPLCQLNINLRCSWAEVERESGLKLVHMTGGLDITRRGNPREQVLEQYAQAMRAQNIPWVEWCRARQKLPVQANCKPHFHQQNKPFLKDLSLLDFPLLQFWVPDTSWAEGTIPAVHPGWGHHHAVPEGRWPCGRGPGKRHARAARKRSRRRRHWKLPSSKRGANQGRTLIGKEERKRFAVEVSSPTLRVCFSCTRTTQPRDCSNTPEKGILIFKVTNQMSSSSKSKKLKVFFLSTNFCSSRRESAH